MAASHALVTQDIDNQLNDVEFLTDVIEGFSAEAKRLSPKYFYDEAGSRHFDDICELSEYYPYKAELGILPRAAKALASHLRGDYAVVEFGAGSLQKIRPLFEQIAAIRRFIPIDISGEFLQQSVEHLRKGFPTIEMQPIVADFSKPVVLPKFDEKKLGFFPGSTIGNFTPVQAREFLQNARQTLGEGAYLLIGVDTKKSPEILHRAYNDKLGVTRRFNLNVLERINRELDGDLCVEQFEHYAYYNPAQGCIEMHLVSMTQQEASVAGVPFSFREGETIHTESSYKYSEQEFERLSRRAGWRVAESWFADERMFSMYLLHVD